MVLVSHGVAKADEAAQVGRQGQALGQQLTDSFQFPTQSSNGAIDLGAGETISPSDMAPNGSGFYIQNPNVDGLKTIYDSEESMYDVGRESQNKLWEDAQAQGNPFDPDPAKRDIPGPSTVSGAAYQVILGVSDARSKVPDLSNDPIISGSGSAMLDDSLLDSFGDCKVETQVTESTRPVRVPEEEFCERVTKPAASSCQVKHELVVEEVVTGGGETYSLVLGYVFNGGAAAMVIHMKRDSDGAVVWGSNGHWRPAPIVVQVDYPTSRLDLEKNPFKYAAQYCPLMGFASVADCKKATVIINGPLIVQGFGSFQGPLAVMQKFNTTTKKLIVKTDRWYPEECVAQAKKS